MIKVNQGIHLPVSTVHQTTLHQTTLHQTTLQNAQRIQHLEHLLRSDQQELQELQCLLQKRNRTSITSSTPTITPTPLTPTPSAPRAPHTPNLTQTLIPTVIPTTPPPPPPPHSQTNSRSPTNIMHTSAPQREMAARGSHWSFVEKARFEGALHRYGPFAWQHIIKAVSTRTEKQVKAYAARYRRRKKLAAKAQRDAINDGALKAAEQFVKAMGEQPLLRVDMLHEPPLGAELLDCALGNALNLIGDDGLGYVDAYSVL